MNGWLDRLILRAQGRLRLVRPRPVSLFEGPAVDAPESGAEPDGLEPGLIPAPVETSPGATPSPAAAFPGTAGAQAAAGFPGDRSAQLATGSSPGQAGGEFREEARGNLLYREAAADLRPAPVSRGEIRESETGAKTPPAGQAIASAVRRIERRAVVPAPESPAGPGPSLPGRKRERPGLDPVVRRERQVSADPFLADSRQLPSRSQEAVPDSRPPSGLSHPIPPQSLRESRIPGPGVMDVAPARPGRMASLRELAPPPAPPSRAPEFVINIGTVEIRAQAPVVAAPAHPTRPSPAPALAPLGLEEYMRGKGAA